MKSLILPPHAHAYYRTRGTVDLWLWMRKQPPGEAHSPKPMCGDDYRWWSWLLPNGVWPSAWSRLECPCLPGDKVACKEPFIAGWPVVDGELQQYDADGNEMPKHVWYKNESTRDGWVSNLGALMAMWTDDNGGFVDSIPWKSSTQMPIDLARTHAAVVAVEPRTLGSITPEEARKSGVTLATDDEIRAGGIWDVVTEAGKNSRLCGFDFAYVGGFMLAWIKSNPRHPFARGGWAWRIALKGAEQ